MTNATIEPTPCRKRELTPTQLAAIDKLLLGKNDRETAEVIGTHRVTVTRWRLHDQVFRAEFKRRRLEIVNGSVNRLRALLPKALDCLAVHLSPRSDDCMKAVAQVFALVKSGALNQDYYEESEIVADQYYEVEYDDDPKVDENEDRQQKTEVVADEQVLETAPEVQKEEPPQEIVKQQEEKIKPVQASTEADLSAAPHLTPPVAEISEPRKQAGKQSDQTPDPTQLSPAKDCHSLGDTAEPDAGATTDPPKTDREFNESSPNAGVNWPVLLRALKKLGAK